MASITNPINSLYGSPAATGTGTQTSSSSGATGAKDPLANESTFLTLLVSQLKNQDPSSPMEGTTFVTQLAQFSDLEQNLAMRTDLDALSSKYAGTASAAASSSSGTSAGTGTDGSSSNGTTGSSTTGNSTTGNSQ